MLPKKNRLTQSEFNAVFSSGKKIHSPNFLVIKNQNQLGFSKFAVSVPKKIIPKATSRNHVKRLLFNAINQSLSNNTAENIIFVIKKEFITSKLSFTELKNEIKKFI